jgi:hypothetical protein
MMSGTRGAVCVVTCAGADGRHNREGGGNSGANTARSEAATAAEPAHERASNPLFTERPAISRRSDDGASELSEQLPQWVSTPLEPVEVEGPGQRVQREAQLRLLIAALRSPDLKRVEAAAAALAKSVTYNASRQDSVRELGGLQVRVVGLRDVCVFEPLALPLPLILACWIFHSHVLTRATAAYMRDQCGADKRAWLGETRPHRT